MDGSQEKIRALAYDLWVQDGQQDGKSEFYWWKAERQLAESGDLDAPYQESRDNQSSLATRLPVHEDRRQLDQRRPIAKALFYASTSGKAHDADDRIIYDTNDGKLYYDADGNGSGWALLIATFNGHHPTLHYTDIIVI